MCVQQALTLRSASISRYIEKVMQVTMTAHHFRDPPLERFAKIARWALAKVALLTEEIKRLELFKFRAKVLNEEVTKLMVELHVFEQKAHVAK